VIQSDLKWLRRGSCYTSSGMLLMILFIP